MSKRSQIGYLILLSGIILLAMSCKPLPKDYDSKVKNNQQTTNQDYSVSQATNECNNNGTPIQPQNRQLGQNQNFNNRQNRRDTTGDFWQQFAVGYAQGSLTSRAMFMPFNGVMMPGMMPGMFPMMAPGMFPPGSGFPMFNNQQMYNNPMAFNNMQFNPYTMPVNYNFPQNFNNPNFNNPNFNNNFSNFNNGQFFSLTTTTADEEDCQGLRAFVSRKAAVQYFISARRGEIQNDINGRWGCNLTQLNQLVTDIDDLTQKYVNARFGEQSQRPNAEEIYTKRFNEIKSSRYDINQISNDQNQNICNIISNGGDETI